jgi:NADP-dependent 3-hydroxy acid dehydrogenase YdfG
MNRRPAIDGKVVIVTGASSGIGESTARQFAQAGAITVLAARRAERLEGLQNEIEDTGGQALAVPSDLNPHHQRSAEHHHSMWLWHLAGVALMLTLVVRLSRRKF